MPMQFTPDTNTSKLEVPYFEDATGLNAPGYTTKKTPAQLQQEIIFSIVRLGASFPVFRMGNYGAGKGKRYGLEIHFQYNGAPSLIQIAGLPMRSETAKKKDQVIAHALYTVNEWLKTMYTSMIFTPGYSPLVQFMLVPGSNKTVGEMLLISNQIPNMNPSLPTGDVVTVTAEIVE